MNTRDLIAYARRNGWDYIRYGAYWDVQHVWRHADWRVELGRYPDHVVVDVYEMTRVARGKKAQKHVGRIVTDSADDLARFLSVLGVLPAERLAA